MRRLVATLAVTLLICCFSDPTSALAKGGARFSAEAGRSVAYSTYYQLSVPQTYVTAYSPNQLSGPQTYVAAYSPNQSSPDEPAAAPQTQAMATTCEARLIGGGNVVGTIRLGNVGRR